MRFLLWLSQGLHLSYSPSKGGLEGKESKNLLSRGLITVGLFTAHHTEASQLVGRQSARLAMEIHQGGRWRGNEGPMEGSLTEAMGQGSGGEGDLSTQEHSSSWIAGPSQVLAWNLGHQQRPSTTLVAQLV